MEIGTDFINLNCLSCILYLVFGILDVCMLDENDVFWEVKEHDAL